MDSAIESTAAWSLPNDAPTVRVATRPLPYRNNDFGELYDATTIFYDCFKLPDDAHAILLGPPFLNLKMPLMRMEIVAKPSGHVCAFHVRHLDRHARTTVTIPNGTTTLDVTSELGRMSLLLRSNASSDYAGKRVMLTLSKDNKPGWIEDWFRFHRDMHGANAMLLYDSGSETYTVQELEARLRGLRGMEVLRIVQWPFKYGPQSYFGKYWDSDYCQLGAYESARWRFLQEARSVMVGDVDELVLSDRGSIFDRAENAKRSYASYLGKWVIKPEDTTGAPATLGDGDEMVHRDFHVALQPKKRWKIWRWIHENRCPRKWTVVPRRCPERAQWKVHKITGMPQQSLDPEQGGYRHFREINTGWKYKRTEREAFDPVKHVKDEALLHAYSRVAWDV